MMLISKRDGAVRAFDGVPGDTDLSGLAQLPRHRPGNGLR